jgi:hypothetical protein
MGLPARVLEALSEFGRDAADAELPSEKAQALSRQEIWLHAVNDLAQRVVRLERLLADIRDLLESLSVEAERGAFRVDLDDVIDSLHDSEQGAKAELSPVLLRIKSTRQGTFSLPGTSPADRARAIAVSDRYAKAITELFQMLRDARWRIMALRAQHEDPGDSPIFDDPQALLQYLDKKAHDTYSDF